MASLSLEIAGKAFPAVGNAPAKQVLGHVSLEIASGEVVALIGPSGCGKTTLLNMVAGLESSAKGEIRGAAGLRIGYVFQEPRLLPWRTVAENLALVIEDEPDRDARVATALAEIGLADSAEVYASRLSLGMARRVALARGFIVRPDLLLLDEPFVSLDEMTAVRLRRLLLDLLDTHRTRALFVTHNLQEAIMVAHRLAFLSGSPGTLIEDVPIRLAREQRLDVDAVKHLRQELLRQGLIDPMQLEGEPI